jgi:hypothetical protein
MSSLEAAKQRLAQQDGTGYSAYEHISEILLKLVAEQPSDALELFEYLSSSIKGARPGPRNSSAATAASGAAAAAESRAAATRWSENCLRLVTGDKDPESDEFVPPPADADEKMEDILHAAEELEWAGVSLGDEETLRVKQAMVRTLGQNDGISNVRFFGKVLGTRADYYVLEAQQDDVLNEDEEADGGFEPLANKSVFYASNDVGGDFQRLPNVSAAAVAASSRIRTFLSGDASAPVAAHPPFPGTEALLLRAIIARIAGETSVAPDYHWQPTEVDEGEVPQEVEPNEKLEDDEFKPPSVAELAAGGLARFRTYTPAHNSNGFLGTPKVADPADPDNKIPDPSAPKPQPAVRALSEGEWQLEASGSGASVVLRSLTWPGLTTLARQKTTTRVYVGYGIRADAPGALQWSPQFPAPIADEVDDAGVREQADNAEKPPEPEPEPEGGAGGEDDE